MSNLKLRFNDSQCTQLRVWNSKLLMSSPMKESTERATTSMTTLRQRTKTCHIRDSKVQRLKPKKLLFKLATKAPKLLPQILQQKISTVWLHHKKYKKKLLLKLLTILKFTSLYLKWTQQDNFFQIFKRLFSTTSYLLPILLKIY